MGIGTGDALGDLATCLRFFSRLPVPGPHHRPFTTAVRLLPVAGLLIGICGALPLALATGVGLPPVLAAILGIAGGVLGTGALHEDGLADCADGLGGTTPERRLAIMRDSRIGSYGVLALILMVTWRLGALATLLERAGPGRVALAMLAAAALSRGLCLLPLATLPPARADGLGRGVGRPTRAALAACFGGAAVLGLVIPALAGFGLARSGAAVLLAAAGAAGVAALARRRLGGHTGDVAGAAQQVADGLFWLGLLLSP